MTLRARLIDMYEIGMANDSANGGKERMADKAALRELDQLIESMVKLGNGGDSLNPNDYWLAMNEWLERAAQAGYGKK